MARFLGHADIITLPVRHEQTKQHLPRAKTLERLKEEEEAKNTAAAAVSEPSVEKSSADDSAGESSADEKPAEGSADEKPAEGSADEKPAEEGEEKNDNK